MGNWDLRYNLPVNNIAKPSILYIKLYFNYVKNVAIDNIVHYKVYQYNIELFNYNKNMNKHVFTDNIYIWHIFFLYEINTMQKKPLYL